MIPYTYYELEAKLEELRLGHSLVIPSSLDHAYQMLHIAQCYINQDRQDVLNALSKEYK